MDSMSKGKEIRSRVVAQAAGLLKGRRYAGTAICDIMTVRVFAKGGIRLFRPAGSPRPQSTPRRMGCSSRCC